MKLLIKTVASAFIFAGILAGCLAVLLMLILMARFPPLLIAVVLACWIFSRLQAAPESSATTAKPDKKD